MKGKHIFGWALALGNMFTSNRIQKVQVKEAEQHKAQVVYNIYNIVCPGKQNLLLFRVKVSQTCWL